MQERDEERGDRMRRPRLSQIFALLATVLSLAGFAYMWLSPSGQSCVSAVSQSGGLQTTCTATTFASSMAPGALAAVLLLSAAFSVIPALFERRAWVQYSWFGVIVAFYLVSFGVDMWLLPAAATAAAGAVSRQLSR